MPGVPPKIGKGIATLLSLLIVFSPLTSVYAAALQKTDTSTSKTDTTSQTSDSSTAPDESTDPASQGSDTSDTSDSAPAQTAPAQVAKSTSSATPAATPAALPPSPPPSGGSGNPPTLNTPDVFSIQSVAPQVNTNSGALTEKIPLDVPPGRNGLQPDVSLEYNSQDTDQDSELGYGWNLSIPYIERLNKTGTQNLYGSNPYFTSSLDGELGNFATTTGNMSSSTTLTNNIVVDWKLDGSSAAAVGTPNGTDINVGYGSAFGKINSGANFNGSTSKIGVNSTRYETGTGDFTVSLWAKSLGASGVSGSDGPALFQVDDTASGAVTARSYLSWDSSGSEIEFQFYDGVNGVTAHAATSSYGTTGIWHHIVAERSGGNGILYIDGVQVAENTYTFGTPASANLSTTQYGYIGGDRGTGGGGFFNGDIDEVGYWNRALTSAEISQLYSSGNGIQYPFTVTTNAPASSLYTARIDDGSDRQYTYATSTNSWTMYDKSGTEYLFGSSSQSQQSSTTSPSTIYKWMLEKVVDTNGNYVRYTYNKDGNQIYPYQIIYTGHNVTDGPMTVTFATSTRPDQVVNWKGGFEEDTNYRISQITAAVSGSTVRQYSLSYTTGNNGTRSLLSSIQENGFDDNNVETSLPAVTFGYVSSTTAFVTQVGSGNVGGDPYIAADVSGNGLNDSTNIACNTSTGPENGYIFPDGGSSTTFTPPQVNNLCWSFGTTGTGALNETGTRFLDINANGKANIAQGSFTVSSGIQSNALYLNTYATSTGYAWSATTTWNGTVPVFVMNPSTGSPYTTGFFGDLNGDGLPDYEVALATTTGESTWDGAYFGNGSAWNQATTTIFIPPKTVATSADCTNSQLVDVNGDGLADWVYTDGTSTYVLLNSGTGWGSTPDSRWTIATSTVYKSGGICYDRGMRFVDVNGDGLPDFIRSYNAVGTAGLPEAGSDQFVYLNTGHGWATSTAYTLPYIINNPSGSTITYSELANFLGNGQQDQDVLSIITYPKGGSTNVTYRYTTQSGTNPKLPYNLLVVTKLVNNDGLLNNTETDYTYSNGVQYLSTNIFDRKFAGFGWVTASTSQAITTTYYSQGATSTASTVGDQSDGYGQLNHPYRQNISSPSGTVVQTIFYQYNPIWHGVNSEFVGLTRHLEQDYAADGTHQDKDIDYTYSTTTDNITQQLSYGQVIGNSDGTFSTSSLTNLHTTNITYGASSSVNLSVPTEKTLLNSSGATTTDSKFFYDLLSFGQVNVGNLTQEQDWATSTSYASSTKTYNSLGLISTSTDRNGNVTSYIYDTLKLYPATTTNALLQSTLYTYDYSNGKAEKTTNPNGGIIKDTYDGLGRLIEIDQSNPASPTTLATTTTYAYTDNSVSPSIISETDYLNAATSSNVYSYYDGLGRLIQKQNSSENNGISSITAFIYNSAGKLASQSLPYFGTSSGTFINNQVNVLVIGGGGGGGGQGGGGGAGGYIANQSFIVSSGVYTATVGSGGSGSASGTENSGSNGATSTFSTLNSAGGGGGGGNTPGKAGGSGGGGSANTSGGTGTSGQGNAGGAGYNLNFPYLGGGGGAGAVGGNGSNTSGLNGSGGNGGTGIVNTISDSSVTYAGGGGGGVDHRNTSGSAGIGGAGGGGAGGFGTTGTNGTVNTGGGGGGSGYNGVIDSPAGGSGGSGVVIISYPTSVATNYSCGGSTTTSGGNTICTFTSSGTFTVTGTAFTGATSTKALYTNYTYDPLGRTLTTANAVGTTTNIYNKWITTTTDPNGGIKDSIQDAFGNLAQVVEHNVTSNATSTYTYDAANNLTNITDALGNIRNFTYDGLGNELTAQDLHASSDVTFGSWAYSYDANGNQISETDPKSQVITHTYDGLNRMLTEAWTGQGTQITNTYDSCTNGIGLLCTASSTAAKDTYAYDVLGRTTGATTTIAGKSYGLADVYDRQGNITNVVNSDGSQLAYIYNTAGLVSAVNKIIGGTSSLVASMINYSPSAQIGQILFGSGASTTYSYNPSALYRLTRIYSRGAGTSTLQDLNYIYDANGNIITRTDNSNIGGGQITTYTYDILNRLLAASTTSGTLPQYGLVYTYDALGNITSSGAGTLNQSSGLSFDNALNVETGSGTSITQSFTTSASSSRLMVLEVGSNTAGSLVSSVTYNGVALTKFGTVGFNTVGVPHDSVDLWYLIGPTNGTHNLVINYSASTFFGLNIATYSGVSQISFPNASTTLAQDTGTTFSTSLCGSPACASGSWTLLAADSQRNITAATNTIARSGSGGGDFIGDSNGQVSGSYTMNATVSASFPTAGFMVSIAPASINSSSTNPNIYTYASTNYADPDAVTSIGNGTATTTYAYDNNGNLISVGTTTFYTYDYRNEMVSSGNGHATTTYAYDPFGNRVSQSNASSTTFYPNKFYSIISTNNGSTTIATTTDYAFGGGTLLATIDQKSINGTATGTAIVRYNHTDNLGSTNVTSDAMGTLAQWFDYAPYGSVITSSNTGTTTATRGYIGQYYDATGLSYLNARYYNSSQGQFTSEDPVFLGYPGKQNLANPQSLNAYSYSDDNPINLSDPSGRLGSASVPGALIGALQSLVSALQGLISTLQNPVGTAVGVGSAVSSAASHPYTTAQNFAQGANSYVQTFRGASDYNQGQMIGSGIVTVGGLFIGDGVGDVGEAGEAASDANLVCRAGGCSTENFIKGSNEYKAGLNPGADTPLTGISVNTGASKGTLLNYLPGDYSKAGFSTGPEITNLGGEVVSSPTSWNPYHSEVNGLTAQQLNNLFQVESLNGY